MTATPIRLDLRCEQGATFYEPLILPTDIPDVDNDLSTWTPRCRVRKQREDATVLLDFSTAFQPIHVDGELNAVVLYLTPTETAALPHGRYVYDVEVESADGEVVRLCRGDFLVFGEVTR